MKKKNALVSGLSVLLLLSATNIAVAQEDDNDSEDSVLEFEHAIVTDDLADLVDILEVIEVARAEYDGVITEIDLERYRDGFYYEIEMESESDEYELKVDAETLDIIETEFESDNDLDSKYRAKLNGEVHSLEEAIESTRMYFDGIIEEFDVDDEDDMVVFEFEIADDHLDVEVEINAADLSIIKYEIETRDRDSGDHRDLIRQNIEDYDPGDNVNSDSDDVDEN